MRNAAIAGGTVVRSRRVVGDLAAGLQTLVGGNITAWSQMCEQAGEAAYEVMARHAQELGATAIIGMRYDATEVSAGVTEVLAYGTAMGV